MIRKRVNIAEELDSYIKEVKSKYGISYSAALQILLTEKKRDDERGL